MALVSPSALATDADTETSLWPAYDPVTGLCVDFCALARVRLDASTEGYINRSGEVVYQWPAQEE